jgi:UDP-glucose 4-epimerase
VREYIHVRDAARLTCAILAPRFANSVLHIYGPEKLTATELLTMIREILGRDVNLVFRGKQDSHHYKTTPFSLSVNERLGQRLISDTYIDLGSGILETLEHLKQNKSTKGTVVAQRVENQ